MRITDQIMPVLICTDATFDIGILSSVRPKKRGFTRNTRSGPTEIRVGKRKLPRVQRLALKVSIYVGSVGSGMNRGSLCATIVNERSSQTLRPCADPGDVAR
jgi:hypothetical protein